MQQASGELDQRLVAAHRAMRAQGDIQMDMRAAPAAPKPPTWLTDFFEWLGKALKPVGRFFRWVDSFLPDWPYVKIIFWTLVAAMALMFLWMAIQRFRHGEWRLPRLRRRTFVQAADQDEAEDWRPDAAPARAWLQEADALAARGEFAEAAHHLLLRSVDDLASRRPQLVRPALTSRDLSRAQGIPAAPRALFAQIAAVVERSLFGGRKVDAEDWTACRAAYADFAQARSWRA
jgi:hypothetical protein